MKADLVRRARARAPAAGPAPVLVALALLVLDPLATVFALPEVMSALGVIPEDLHRGVLAPGLFVGAAAAGAWWCARRSCPTRGAFLAALALNAAALLVAATASSLAPYLCARVVGGLAAGVAFAVAPTLLADAGGAGRAAPTLWAALATAPFLTPLMLSAWDWTGTYAALALAAVPCAAWVARRAPAGRTQARPLAGDRRSLATGAAAALAGSTFATLLVYAPLFARVTRDSGSVDGAAGIAWRAVLPFVLVAWAGERLARPVSARTRAVLGLVGAVVALVVMSAWSASALRGVGCWFALIGVGVGLGAAVHPLRRVGLLPWLAGAAVGIWAVTLSGQARFNDLLGRILPPEDLCPAAPGQCAPYELQVRLAVLEQFQAVFLNGALCAALAAVLVAFVAAPRERHA
ncbi:MAG: hypothetical protein ACT4QF_18760 [Sporichthyaceae bacterium]